ncbi:hypothetical protein RFI_25470 [Reticulomyxa filosa]|uniref:Uncharacterized protein n=1 Tax=Reticulomyxa filosa TaxID=46433 RepID=X6MFV8_RETFI|nr:hypothetical protein RFI_25470 [Reticulomyxa filosa]|eukprot:ETO11905.1 hypothetical protein RFI_25470 [Reticulomyxa filosa]
MHFWHVYKKKKKKGPNCDPTTFERSVPSTNCNCDAYYQCQYDINVTASSQNGVCDDNGAVTYKYHLAKDETLCIDHYSFSYGAGEFSRNQFVTADCSGPPQLQDTIMSGCAFSSLLHAFAKASISDKSEPVIWKAVPQLLMEADINLLKIDVHQTTVEIMLMYRGTQMADVWFGMGFGSIVMDGTYAMIYQPLQNISVNNRFKEYKLGHDSLGVMLPSSLLFSKVVESGPSTTITMVRPVQINDNRYFSFDFDTTLPLVQVPVIFARGVTKSLQYHGSFYGSGVITFQCVGKF